GGGDRPYFNLITFQTQMFTPGSTKVQVIEREPHDWVSKDEFNGNGTLLKGKDHMLEGDSLPIPNWMGQFEWNGGQWLDLQNVKTLNDLKVMLLGAVIISVDNHNTPPGMIRDLLDQAAQGLNSQLQSQIESGTILAGLNPLDPPAVLSQNLQARFKQI